MTLTKREVEGILRALREGAHCMTKEGYGSGGDQGIVEMLSPTAAKQYFGLAIGDLTDDQQRALSPSEATELLAKLTTFAVRP